MGLKEAPLKDELEQSAFPYAIPLIPLTDFKPLYTTNRIRTNQHFISAKQFADKESRDLLYKTTDLIATLHSNHPQQFADELTGFSLVTLMDENSTRTFTSLQQGMILMGGGVISLNKDNSSIIKAQESWEHTIRVLSGQGDLFSFRSSDPNLIENVIAQGYVKNSVINAGSGDKEHPYQAAKNYTFFRKLNQGKELSGNNLIYNGDLRAHRAFHSDIWWMREMEDAEIILVTPPNHTYPKPEMLDFLKSGKAKISVYDSLHKIPDNTLQDARFMMTNRLQEERRKNDPAILELLRKFYPQNHQVTQDLLDRSPNLLHSHAMPVSGIIQEIPPDIDHNPQTIMFEHSDWGKYVAAALSKIMLKGL